MIQGYLPEPWILHYCPGGNLIQKNKKKELSPEEKNGKAAKYISRYSHSNRKLYKAIIDALPPCKRGNSLDTDAIALTLRAGKIMDLLAESSRTWNISIHWIYTVCNPQIKRDSNVKYSPVYRKYQCELPLNRFGELDRLVEEDDGSYVRLGDKLVGDSRFIGHGSENFGTSWNENGEVIKRDAENHPVLDGFAGLTAQHIDNLQQICCKNPNRDRHFAAFLIAHTRDDEPNKRDGTVDHKEAHIHTVIDMPTRRSRYQMMEMMGYNFDDLTETFKWIKHADNKKDRIAAFLGTLQGAMQNYVVTENYVSSLQYLVHQSSKAKCDQKTPYAVNEVISWLPDDPGKSYSSIAGVYDDEIVAEGAYADIIRNLHSDYNVAHHTADFVGRNEGARLFTYRQLVELRNLGTRGAGKLTFSAKSKKMIFDRIISWIYQGKMEMTDWQKAIHGAFPDSDAAELITDGKFIQKLESILDDQRESTINDTNADRKMMTIFISAEQGGIGKTLLANHLCQYYGKGRTPYMTAAEDKSKTVDYWQDYRDQSSAIIDEVSPSSIEWSALKDMLDPHKIPRVSSRYHNACPWNLKLLVMTNVYYDGISGYIREVLHYAPGVTKLGYLEQDSDNFRNWHRKTNDIKAAQIYLSQLSQLLRRLPINIHMSSASNGKGTKIVISIINFRPGGRTLQNYDYVYTQESEHVFNAVINDDLPVEELDKITRTVARMIQKLKEKAEKIFKNDPNVILNEKTGFHSMHYNLGYYVNNGQPFLYSDVINDDSGIDECEPIDVHVSPSVDENLLTKLRYFQYELLLGLDSNLTNFNPRIDQVTALLQGNEVPVERENERYWKTMRLSDKGVSMAQRNQVLPIIMRLNAMKSIEKSDDLFIVGRSNQIARILPNSVERK